MKVRMIRTCLALGEHREAGKTYDLPDRTARELIVARRAVALAPEIETRDPQIALGDAAESIVKKSSRTPK